MERDDFGIADLLLTTILTNIKNQTKKSNIGQPAKTKH